MRIRVERASHCNVAAFINLACDHHGTGEREHGSSQHYNQQQCTEPKLQGLAGLAGIRHCQRPPLDVLKPIVIMVLFVNHRCDFHTAVGSPG